jgi:hypothetical protein
VNLLTLDKLGMTNHLITSLGHDMVRYFPDFALILIQHELRRYLRRNVRPYMAFIAVGNLLVAAPRITHSLNTG